MDKEELRSVGLKVTLPRMRILEILQQSDTKHLNAEDIHKALVESGDDVGLATVYRVLSQFEQAGIIVRHQFDSDSAKYEMNQGEHHDHLVCERCGMVEEFLDLEIEKRQKQVAANAGFVMTDHSLNIYGICRACQ